MKARGECASTVSHPSQAGGTFEEIYRRWFASVCAWIRAMGGPDSDRDDIAQDVFLVVRRRLAAFDGANLPGWLYRITQRQVRDFRRRAWFKHRFFHRNRAQVDGLVTGASNPGTALEQKEDTRMLHAILDKIREPRRVTFVLYEIEGMSGEDIAQIQGIPLNTVWTRLHHARRDFFAIAAKVHRSDARDLVPRSVAPKSDGRYGR